MSQAIAASQAPPHTPPSIMAMTGAAWFSMARMRRRKGSYQPSGSRCPSGNSSTSWPADQILTPALALNTTARTRFSPKVSNAAISSSAKVAQSALRFSKWSRQTVPIALSIFDSTNGMPNPREDGFSVHLTPKLRRKQGSDRSLRSGGLPQPELGGLGLSRPSADERNAFERTEEPNFCRIYELSLLDRI